MYIRKNASFRLSHLVAKTYFCVMNRFYYSLIFVCCLLLISCTDSRRQLPEVPRPASSVYYWRHRPDLHRQVILYPLDSKNIERHSSSRYEEIYRP